MKLAIIKRGAILSLTFKFHTISNAPHIKILLNDFLDLDFSIDLNQSELFCVTIIKSDKISNVKQNAG